MCLPQLRSRFEAGMMSRLQVQGATTACTGSDKVLTELTTAVVSSALLQFADELQQCTAGDPPENEAAHGG